jgi:hypothetical protein
MLLPSSGMKTNIDNFIAVRISGLIENIHLWFKRDVNLQPRCSSGPQLKSKTTVFWNVAPWSVVEIDRRFRGVASLIRAQHGAPSQKRVIFILSYSPP